MRSQTGQTQVDQLNMSGSQLFSLDRGANLNKKASSTSQYNIMSINLEQVTTAKLLFFFLSGIVQSQSLVVQHSLGSEYSQGVLVIIVIIIGFIFSISFSLRVIQADLQSLSSSLHPEQGYESFMGLGQIIKYCFPGETQAQNKLLICLRVFLIILHTIGLPFLFQYCLQIITISSPIRRRRTSAVAVYDAFSFLKTIGQAYGRPVSSSLFSFYLVVSQQYDFGQFLYQLRLNKEVCMLKNMLRNASQDQISKRF